METGCAISSETARLEHYLHWEVMLRNYVDENPESAWWELCEMYTHANNRKYMPGNLALAKSVVVETVNSETSLTSDNKAALVGVLSKLEEYSVAGTRYMH